MNTFFDISDFYEWLDDLSKIQSVYGLLKFIAEFIGEEVDFDTDNLFEWYDIERYEQDQIAEHAQLYMNLHF